MIYMKKNERESDEGLIRRFSRKIQQSGVLRQVRSTRFLTKSKSKEKLRSTAMYKSRMRKEIEHLKKMGHYNPEAIRELRKRLKQDRDR